MDWLVYFLINSLYVLIETSGIFKISVLIFAEGQFEDTVDSVKTAYEEIFQSASYAIGNYTITPEYVDGGTLNYRRGRNRLDLTKEVVCHELLNKSLATVIYASSLRRETHELYLSLAKSTLYALSFYQLPAIGVMVREAEFSKKRVYKTFIRSSPAFSDESYVFLHLLNYLNYRQVVVVNVRGDPNGIQFVEMFELKKLKYKIHVQRYVELEINDSLNVTLLEQFEEATSNIIILYANQPDAEAIFDAAGDLTGPGKVWIINEEASKAKNVPSGALASRLSQSPVSALRTSFAILKNGLQFLATLDETIEPPKSCRREDVHSSWTEKHGPMFYNAICSTSTNKIEFNERCERISVNYDIVSFADEPFDVGALHGNHLRLNEDIIPWNGGKKPLEISLPKHLRAVTINDPPFVYVTPTIHLSGCKNLGTIPIALSGKEIINVPGPWLPCPKYSFNYTAHYCCAGYAIDLLTNLSVSEVNSSMDTSFSFSLHLNDSYGSVLLSDDVILMGFYLTGALGELDSDMADLAVGGMTINPERERYIDFSEPWLYHGIRILEKSIPRDSPMQSFLQPLKSSLWTALLISVLFVGLAIYNLDKNSPFNKYHKIIRKNEPRANLFEDSHENQRVSFEEAMWFVWGVLLNSGVSEKTPSSISARVLGIVWCGFCMIMVASYTANLAAFLVLDQPEKGLTGITDPRLRNPSANFSFGTVLNSNVYQYFKRHVELSTMFRKMEAHNVKQVSYAIEALINGSLDAFIWDSTRLDFEAARHCELRTRGALFGRSAYGIGLQKNSPWTPHITSAILRMTESGVMEQLDAKWIDSSESKCVIEVHKSPARLGLMNMKDVFILVSGGVAAGALFSVIEVTYGRRKAASGRKRALAMRYVEKWKAYAFTRPQHSSYNLSRPLIRRGVGGIESLSLSNSECKVVHPVKSSRPRPFVPDLDFGRVPARLFCSRCRSLIETDLQREAGLFAYFCSFVLILLLLWPCSPIPCYMDSFSDFVHVCPLCSHRIGRYRKFRSSKFYV